MSTYSMTRRLEWDMGHRVPLHSSKCKNLHGHRYVAEITCEAEVLTGEGFVVDFGVVKQIVGTWIDQNWDHNVMYQHNDVLMGVMAHQHQHADLKSWYAIDDAPTAEHIARELFNVATDLLADERVRVTKVVIHETPNCKAEWTG